MLWYTILNEIFQATVYLLFSVNCLVFTANWIMSQWKNLATAAKVSLVSEL